MSSLNESALLAQAGPSGLALATDRHFETPRHVNLINREIVEAVARAQTREREEPEILLVEVPPRHGKSTLISEHTPAWFLGLFPDQKVILASYEADFASTWGAKARGLLQENGEALYGVRVNQSSKAAKRWDVKGHKGGMITAGVGGPITGKGAHLMIVDDPIKNAEQALSEVIRAKQWDWWLSTARTRLEPGAVVIVLMTRWHEDDLGGKLLTEASGGGDQVREIRLPALAVEDDLLGREPGEALWPARYSRRYLEHTREVLGGYWFAAMYQGTPTPDEGGVFSRRDFHYFNFEDGGNTVELRRPDGSWQSFGADWCRKFQVVDLAESEKKTADYTVIAEIWATPENDMLVRSVIRERIAGPDQPKFFRAHHQGMPVKIEAIGYQSSLIKTMLREGFPAEAVYPDKDKVTRASTAGALYKAGKVYHLAGAEWLTDFETELLAFPAGKHDDQVDTIAYAARALPDLEASTSYTQKDRGQTLTGGLMTQQL